MTGSLLDSDVLSRRYFFPRGERAVPSLEVTVDGAVLHCVASLTTAERPVLVHFHGNGETAADYAPDVVNALSALGIDSLFAEYRGYGGSTGSPALVRMLSDVECVLKATGRSAQKTFVYGRSVGSIYALEAARVWPELAGVIIESGIADVAERVRLRVTPEDLGATAEQVAQEIDAHLNHRQKVEHYSGKLLVLHALQDRTLDISHGRRLRKWARHGELVQFEAGDHNSVFALNTEAILEALTRFVLG